MIIEQKVFFTMSFDRFKHYNHKDHVIKPSTKRCRVKNQEQDAL